MIVYDWEVSRNKKYDKLILKRLKGIKRTPSFLLRLTRSSGICGKVASYGFLDDMFGLSGCDYEHYANDTLRSLFREWPHFSRNSMFPVPHSLLAASSAYSKESRWDKRTNYGQLRYDLVDFLIEKMKDRIEGGMK